MKEVKLSWRDPAISELECILGRGDRRVSQVIYSAWKQGTKFDGWTDQFRYDIWLDAYKKNNLEIERYIKEIPETSSLPWNHIDKGVANRFLKEERQKAYSQTLTENCRNSVCHICGIQRKNDFAEYVTCHKHSRSIDKTKKTDQIDLKKAEAPVLRNNKEENRIHLRIHYQKLGYTKYISHLDLIRLFDRIFRRSGIHIAYTNGYNKRPKMSFGPPLSLGHTSDSEYMDIEVNSPPQKNIKKAI